jgi:thiol-disulfide isomerase/thioredoxin
MEPETDGETSSYRQSLETSMRFTLVLPLAALALASLAAAQGPSSNAAETKLAEINALKPPARDAAKGNDPAYMAEYLKKLDAWAAQRGKLILAFVGEFPEHADSTRLLGSYFSNLKGFSYPAPPEKIASSIKTIDAFVAKSPRPEFVQLGKYFTAIYRQLAAEKDAPKQLAIAEEYAKAYPDDPNGANLMRTAAENSPDTTQKIAVYEKMVQAYPKDQFIEMYKGTVRRLKSVGKPFEISFTDAITGKKVDSASLKGKVVLVDFWATWCGPCIAKMPDLLKLYSANKAKGFEIVGVSLDNPESEGGLTSLKDYVAKNKVGWPQYYEGKGWFGAFNSGWGIMSIPTAFLVDKKGVLRSVDVGDNMAAQVEALLKE